MTKNISELLVSNYGDDVTVFTTVAHDVAYFWGASQTCLPAGMTIINEVKIRRFPVFNRVGKIRMLLAHTAHRLNLPYNDWLRTIYNGPLIFGMTKAIANSQADVIFATAFPLMHMYYAMAGAKQGNIPIILAGAIHTADKLGYERKMMYHAIHEANAYIALTRFEREHLIKRGIPGDKISVVGAGVYLEKFKQAHGDIIRQKYGWDDKPVVAIIGKQGRRKRFDILLEAMPHVWRVHPHVQFLIAGGHGGYSAEIERQIANFSATQQEHVTVVYDFVEDEKPNILEACDILVLPSSYESFGIVFVEAWSCKKPVVGANMGAVATVIDDGVDGLLFEYENSRSLAQAILTLLADKIKRHAMGIAGYQKVKERYTWQIVTEKIRKVYLQT